MNNVIIGRGYKWRGKSLVGVNTCKTVYNDGTRWLSRAGRTSMPDTWVCSEHEAEDVYETLELFEELMSRGAHYRNSCEILGSLTPYAEKLVADGARNIPRLKRAKTMPDGTNYQATFEDAARNSHQLDIDNILMPGHLSANDPIERHVEWLRNDVLPPELAEVDLLAMATGSFGVSGNQLKLRLRLFTKEPLTLRQFGNYVKRSLNPHMAGKCYFTKGEPCDTSIYQAARMMFFLPPIVEGAGFPFLQNRLIVSEGNQLEAELPSVEAIRNTYAEYAELNDIEPLGNGRVASLNGALNLIGVQSHQGMLRLGMWLGDNYAPNELRAAIQMHRPDIARRLRETATDEAHYQQRLTTELDNDTLLRSALDWQEKRSEWHAPVIVDSEDLDADFATEEKSDEARADMRKQIGEIVPAGYDRQEHETPRHVLARVTTGGGKTSAMIAAIAPDDVYNHLTHVFVPDHGLKSQIEADLIAHLNDASLEPFIHSHAGRGQPGMCPDRDNENGTNIYNAMAEALERGGSSPREICQRCPFSETCPHYNQALPEKGIALFTHADLTTTCANITPGGKYAADFVIIDEDCTATLLNKTKTTINDLAPDSYVKFVKTKLGFSPAATADFVAHREGLAKALRTKADSEGEWISRISVGQTRSIRENITQARETEWRIINQVTDEINKAVERGDEIDSSIAGQAIARSRSALNIFTLIDESGRNEARDHVYGLRVYENGAVFTQMRAPLPAYIKQTNALWLDATANAQIWQRTLNTMPDKLQRDVIDFEIKPTHYTAVQVMDKNDRFTQRRLTTDAKGKRPTQQLQRCARLISMKAIEHRNTTKDICGADVLVISQKSVRAELESKFDLPDNVHFMHYNAIRGKNGYEKVRCLVLIGRVLASDFESVLQAEALVFDDQLESAIPMTSPPTNKIYFPTTHTVRDGSGGTYRISGRAPSHEVTSIADVIEQTTNAEVKQALGRARLVNRTAETPCDVVVLTNTPIDLALDATYQTITQATPAMYQFMLQVGVVPCGFYAAKAAYPHIVGGQKFEWKSTKEALERRKDQWRDWPIKKLGKSMRVHVRPGAGSWLNVVEQQPQKNKVKKVDHTKHTSNIARKDASGKVSYGKQRRLAKSWERAAAEKEAVGATKH